jgi:ATP-dependent protease ClpP protease subunit
MFFGKRHKLANNEDEDEDEGDERTTARGYVQRYKNSIYFYSEVDRKSVLTLIKLIKEATFEIQKQCLETGGEGRIYVHICSDGGSVFEGLAAMDTISSNPVHVTTVMEGAVCSAATFIALGGDSVAIRPSAHVLIHQISSSFWGKYEEFVDEKYNLDKLMDKLKDIYTTHTSIPKKVLADMFTRDIYIDSSECMKWDIVDKIM